MGAGVKKREKRECRHVGGGDVGREDTINEPRKEKKVGSRRL